MTSHYLEFWSNSLYTRHSFNQPSSLPSLTIYGTPFRTTSRLNAISSISFKRFLYTTIEGPGLTKVGVGYNRTFD
jgi:hypothetical protein